MRLLSPLAVSLTGLFLVAGCIGPEVPPDDDGEGESKSVQVRDLESGQYSGHSEKIHRVIATPEDWESFWQTHARGEIPTRDAPEVDFGSERVVVVVQGDRPNGCYHVRITDVLLVDGETRVDVTQYVPSEDMVCTDVIVQPHHFIAVPADGTDVGFQEHEVEGFPEQ